MLSEQEWLCKWMEYLGPHNQTDAPKQTFNGCFASGWCYARDFHYNLPWCILKENLLVKNPGQMLTEAEPTTLDQSTVSGVTVTVVEESHWRHRIFGHIAHVAQCKSFWNRIRFSLVDSEVNKPHNDFRREIRSQREPRFCSGYRLYRLDQVVPRIKRSGFSPRSIDLRMWQDHLVQFWRFKSDTPLGIVADFLEERCNSPEVVTVLRRLHLEGSAL